MKPKTRQKWTFDEKLMVWVSALFIAGFGAFSWREGHTQWIELQRFINHSDPKDGIYDIIKIEFSPDSKKLVAVHQGADGGVATVFDVQTRERLADLQIPPVAAGSRAVSAVVQDACWTLDGAYLAGIVNDGAVGATKIKTSYKPYSRFNTQQKIATWSATSGNLIWMRPYAVTSTDSYAKLQLSSDGKTLIGQGTPAVVFDAATGTPLSPNGASAPNGEFNFDGSLLAVTRPSDKMLEVREVKNGRVLWRPKIKRSLTQWSKNNVLGVRNYSDKNEVRLQLWDGKTRRVLPAPKNQNIGAFALHPQLSQVAWNEVKLTKSKSREVESSVLRVWNTATQKEIWHRSMSGDMNLNWSPDGRYLCAIERTGTFPQANLWIFDAHGEVKSKFGRSAVNFVAWSPDSRMLAIAELDGIEIQSVE